MASVYKLSRSWRNIFVLSSAGLFIIFLLPVFFGNTSGKISDFILGAFLIGGISSLLSYGAIESKIITSQGGSEKLLFVSYCEFILRSFYWVRDLDCLKSKFNNPKRG